jgi:hypothetical protein
VVAVSLSLTYQDDFQDNIAKKSNFVHTFFQRIFIRILKEDLLSTEIADTLY